MIQSILLNMGIMALLTVPGILIARLKPNQNFAEALTFLALYVCQPVLTVVSFQRIDFSADVLKNMGLALVFSVVAQLATMMLSLVIFRSKTEQGRSGALRYGSSFSNCAFIGIPLMQSLFGEDNPEVIAFSTVFIAVFNVLSWTVGVYGVTGDKKYISVKKALFNPAVLALIPALIFFFFNAHIADLSANLFSEIELVGNMVTPVAMIILGLKIGSMKMKEIFLNGGAYIASAYKLIFCPLFMLLLMLPFPVDPLLKTSMFFAMAMPSAITTVIFSENFGGDGATAASCVTVSTVLCTATVPLLYLLV